MIAQDFVEPSIDWFALTPLLVLLGGGLTLLVAGALTPTWPRGCYATFTALVAGAAGGLAMFQWDDITDEGAIDDRLAGARLRHARRVPDDHDLRCGDPRVARDAVTSCGAPASTAPRCTRCT